MYGKLGFRDVDAEHFCYVVVLVIDDGVVCFGDVKAACDVIAPPSIVDHNKLCRHVIGAVGIFCVSLPAVGAVAVAVGHNDDTADGERLLCEHFGTEKSVGDVYRIDDDCGIRPVLRIVIACAVGGLVQGEIVDVQGLLRKQLRVIGRVGVYGRCVCAFGDIDGECVFHNVQPHGKDGNEAKELRNVHSDGFFDLSRIANGGYYGV